MKIILTAFSNQMIGKPMDVPENTTPIFRMALMQPIQVFNDGYLGRDVALMDGPLSTMCEFQWTGKYLDDARVYTLIRIS